MVCREKRRWPWGLSGQQQMLRKPTCGSKRELLHLAVPSQELPVEGQVLEGMVDVLQEVGAAAEQGVGAAAEQEVGAAEKQLLQLQPQSLVLQLQLQRLLFQLEVLLVLQLQLRLSPARSPWLLPLRLCPRSKRLSLPLPLLSRTPLSRA